MKLLDLFEEEDEVGVKDPKANQALTLARSKYGWANNDLEAFVSMMQDEQESQDDDIESQFNVNNDQEKSISKNNSVNNNQTHTLDTLAKRISDLEGGATSESITEEDGEAEYYVDDITDYLDEALYHADEFVKEQGEVKSTSVPAGPDTTKFRAQQGNMSEMVSNISIQGNPYSEALKVGGAYDYATVHKEVWDILTALAQEFNGQQQGRDYHSSIVIEAIDGKVVVKASSGTNWSLYGYHVISQRNEDITEDNNVQPKPTAQKINPQLANRIQKTFEALNHQIDMELDKETVQELQLHLNKLKQLAEMKGIVLEDNIDWEPQPKFRGIGGKSTSYGDSAKRQRAMKNIPSANRRYDRPQVDDFAGKLQNHWNKIKKIIQQNPTRKQELMPVMRKIMAAAKQRGIQLT